MGPDEELWRRLTGRFTVGDGCWEWTGAMSRGHGYATAHGKRTTVHRIIYEILVGPIPGGLHLDHLCRNRGCVNPAHLEPVTNGENILRGESPTAANARKTHCDRGHPYDESNTYFYPKTGYRNCRTCHNDLARERYAARS